jgi:ABC-type antimicrobial peptide transport system permease subunit
MDRDLPLIDLRTMTEQIETTVSGERMFAQLTSAFGALALMLASIGIYGIMAYTVARRMNEIGIRMALGAPTRKVLLMILREASALAVIGISVGLGAGLLLMRSIRSMLFGLNPTDAFTLASAALLLLAIAMLAGWGPARRASLIQPIQALNRE